MVPSRWPFIGNIRYESPPKYRSYGPDEDDQLEPEQRAAKRRRIEQNANDYLKGKELYISSAVLKGTFASNCANPWRRNSRDIDVPRSDDGEDEVEDDHGRRQLMDFGRDHKGGHAQKLKRMTENGQLLERPVVDTWDNTRVERPSSRASAGYCAEWLQRQNTRSRTPTIASDEEIDRPRRRTSIITTKSPTQCALSRKLARNSSPVKARHATSLRKDRSSPSRPQSPSIELRRNQVTTVEHDYSAVSRLPESMDVTAGSSTLQHLGFPEDTTTADRLERHRVDMPPPRCTGFTAINSPSKDGGTTISDSARRGAEHQLPTSNAPKIRHEVLRSAENIARRTVSVGGKDPFAAAHNSRHPYIASPAVANGSPGFPYRRISDDNKAPVSVPVSREVMIQTISHITVQESRAKPSRFESSRTENFGLEQSRVQHVGTEDSLLEQDHAARRRDGHTRVTQGRAQGNRIEQSRMPIIEPDSVLGNDEPVYEEPLHDDPMDDMELNDAALDAPTEIPVDAISPRSGSEITNIGEVRIVEPSAEDIHLHGIMAKWRCPVPSCPREFNTRGGLASHITRGHKLQVTKDMPSGKLKRKGASKSVKPAVRAPKRRIEQEEDVDATGSIYNPTLKNVSKTKRISHRSPAPQLPEPSPAPQLPEPFPAPEFPQPSTAPQLPEPAPAAQLPDLSPAHQGSEPSPASPLPPPSLAPQLPALGFEMPAADKSAEAMPLPEIDTISSPKGRIDAETVTQDTIADDLVQDDSVEPGPDDVLDENAIDYPSPPPVQQSDGSGEESTKERFVTWISHCRKPANMSYSISTNDKASTADSGPTIPDHQDSRAYSTFTFNPEQSTQAALLQAQLAFQETQADDQDSETDELNAITPLCERASSAAVSKSAYSLGAVTPFRELNNLFSAPAASTPVFPVLPAATQDLEAAAAGVMFSTVKKPRTKKRISFENWPTTKPSKGSEAKAPTKGVEWSLFASETPVPKSSYVASPFVMNGGDESEVDRSENLPIEHEYEEITVLEAASSSFLTKAPKANSFAAPTPRSRMESFLARTDSFSPRPMAMSSAFSLERKGGQSSSTSSDVPVPSFQEGQGGMLAELNSEDVDAILDDTNYLLGSWNPEQGDKSSFVAASFPVA